MIRHMLIIKFAYYFVISGHLTTISIRPTFAEVNEHITMPPPPIYNTPQSATEDNLPSILADSIALFNPN